MSGTRIKTHSVSTAIAVENRRPFGCTRHSQAVDIVTHDMRGDRPVGQQRHARRTSLDEPIDAEPGIGLVMAADEDGVTARASANELAKGVPGAWPQRTLTDLASLAAEGNERMAGVAPGEFEVTDVQLYRLRDPSPGECTRLV